MHLRIEIAIESPTGCMHRWIDEHSGWRADLQASAADPRLALRNYTITAITSEVSEDAAHAKHAHRHERRPLKHASIQTLKQSLAR